MKKITILVSLVALVACIMAASGQAFHNPPMPPRGMELQGPPPDAIDGMSPDESEGLSLAAADGPSPDDFDGMLPVPLGPPPDKFGPPPGPFGLHPGPHGPPMAALAGPPPGAVGPPHGMFGPPGMVHGRKHGPPPEMIDKIIGLTDQQRKDIKLQHVNFMERTRKNRTSIFSLMDEKKNMLLSGKIDQDKMGKLDEEIVKHRIEILKEKLKLERDRLALLKQDQVDRLTELMNGGRPKPLDDKMHGQKKDKGEH
ncbi:MAG: hypothetical protein HY912_24575 [Desulfomonile tiedjei]|uniref:P pilus assembly/Cpx signaling pathway, periplasmic inhibitor/zinc-resistance associated protein n=1 Tax=Desulfomonile tiedjei TaxID=2358 RepID=A0A9D6V831_9BACT|nr:hypothetical protein [Desulfomonile tiedjei]